MVEGLYAVDISFDLSACVYFIDLVLCFALSAKSKDLYWLGKILWVIALIYVA